MTNNLINTKLADPKYEFNEVLNTFARLIAKTDFSPEATDAVFDAFAEETRRTPKIWKKTVMLETREVGEGENRRTETFCRTFNFDDVITMVAGKTGNPKQLFIDTARQLAAEKFSGEWINGEKRPIDWINASIQKIPHNPDEATFLYAFSKLFCTQDNSFVLQNLNSVRIMCENIHYTFGTEGAKYAMCGEYFFSQTKGNGKTTVAKLFAETIKSYGAPSTKVEITGRQWIDRSYSENALVYIDDMTQDKKFSSVEFANFLKQMIVDRIKGEPFPKYNLVQKNQQERFINLIANIIICSNIAPLEAAGRRLCPVNFGNEFGFNETKADSRFELFDDFTKALTTEEGVKWCKMLIESCPFGRLWEENVNEEETVNANTLIEVARAIARQHCTDNDNAFICSTLGLIRAYNRYVADETNKPYISKAKEETITEQVMNLWKAGKIKAVDKNNGKYKRFDFRYIYKLPFTDEVERKAENYDVSYDEIETVMQERGYYGRKGNQETWRAFVKNELTMMKLGAKQPTQPTDPEKQPLPTEPQEVQESVEMNKNNNDYVFGVLTEGLTEVFTPENIDDNNEKTSDCEIIEEEAETPAETANITHRRETVETAVFAEEEAVIKEAKAATKIEEKKQPVNDDMTSLIDFAAVETVVHAPDDEDTAEIWFELDCPNYHKYLIGQQCRLKPGSHKLYAGTIGRNNVQCGTDDRCIYINDDCIDELARDGFVKEIYLNGKCVKNRTQRWQDFVDVSATKIYNNN